MKLEKYLGKIITIKIDRPMGSKHPKHGFIYPINYGFIPNTKSGDNEELDVYLLGIFEPVEEYTGRCVAFIERLNENDPKLIIAPKDKRYYVDQIESLVEFQERFFDHKIVYDSGALYNLALPHPFVLQKIIEDLVETGVYSVSRVQTKFMIDHGTVTRLTRLFFELGIIGPQNGNKPRKLLLNHYDEITNTIDSYKEKIYHEEGEK